MFTVENSSQCFPYEGCVVRVGVSGSVGCAEIFSV